MILGSLAKRALGSFNLATGSLVVTCSLPRETNIQPSVPSNLRLLGNSSLTLIRTPFAYRPSVLNLPCTSHSPLVGKSPQPDTSRGPVYSVSIAQCALSM